MMPAFWLLTERLGMFARHSKVASACQADRDSMSKPYCKKRQLWRRKTADLDMAARVHDSVEIQVNLKLLRTVTGTPRMLPARRHYAP